MNPDSVITTLKVLFSVSAIILVWLFMLRPLIRMLREKPDVDMAVPDYENMLEGEELEIPTGEEARGLDRNAIIKQLREDPQSTALVVQQWLRDKRK